MNKQKQINEWIKTGKIKDHIEECWWWSDRRECTCGRDKEIDEYLNCSGTDVKDLKCLMLCA